MKALVPLASASLLVFAATACKQDLTVENSSNPDVAHVFATGPSIEATIGSAYQTVHNATSNQNLWPEALMHALEQYSSLNNFNMGVRVAIPRAPIVNSTGAPSVFTEFSALSRQSRLSVEALDALDKYVKSGQTLGTPAQDMRARAFGFFGAGTSLGWMAMIYDSAGVVNTGMPMSRRSRSPCWTARTRTQPIQSRAARAGSLSPRRG
jgi:hypothetical protein